MDKSIFWVSNCVSEFSYNGEFLGLFGMINDKSPSKAINTVIPTQVKEWKLTHYSVYHVWLLTSIVKISFKEKLLFLYICLPLCGENVAKFKSLNNNPSNKQSMQLFN